MSNRLINALKSKDGSEILQTLVIISIIGAISILLVATFRKEITKRVGHKIEDGTVGIQDYDTSLGATLINGETYKDKNRITYNQ